MCGIGNSNNSGGGESKINDATTGAESNGDLTLVDNDSSLSSVINFIDQISQRVEKLELQQYSIQRRALIQKGRFFYWNKHGEDYLNTFTDSIYIVSYEIEGSNGFYTVTYPSMWDHFIAEFVQAQETTVGFLDILMENDTYGDLPVADLCIDATTAASTVRYLNENKLKQLFDEVFGENN